MVIQQASIVLSVLTLPCGGSSKVAHLSPVIADHRSFLIFGVLSRVSVFPSVLRPFSSDPIIQLSYCFPASTRHRKRLFFCFLFDSRLLTNIIIGAFVVHGRVKRQAQHYDSSSRNAQKLPDDIIQVKIWPYTLSDR